MIRKLLFLTVMSALICAHLVALSKTTVEKKMLPTGEGLQLVLPPILLKITALEFDGLLSDYLYLETLTYYGGTMDRLEKPRIRDGEWRWFEMTLAAVTVLDPYFLDPYLFGNSILTWEAGRFAEANELLDKGRQAREWDWMLPFLMGFNQFYFLQENEKAAEFLMEASRRPSADPMLVSIASKLAFKEKKTETSIQFLEEMLLRTDDESIKQRFRRRIEALRGILLLEQAVAQYQKRYHQKPHSFELLVAKGIIQNVPQDPYGGNFYLDPTGSVRSTTERELIPHRK